MDFSTSCFNSTKLLNILVFERLHSFAFKAFFKWLKVKQYFILLSKGSSCSSKCWEYSDYLSIRISAHLAKSYKMHMINLGCLRKVSSYNLFLGELMRIIFFYWFYKFGSFEKFETFFKSLQMIDLSLTSWDKFSRALRTY